DSIFPSVTLLTYVNGSTKVNYKTNLYFETADLTENTISLVKYTWDKLGSYWYTSDDFDFVLNVLPIYAHGSVAKFFIYVEDLVGNNFTYTFSFSVDIEAPIIDLQTFDAAEGEWVDVTHIYYVQSSKEIVYNNSANDDLTLFQYAWNWTGDNEDLDILDASVSWTIYTPLIDGSYNLTVILTDDTAGSPNRIDQTFYFLVDNIVLDFNTPEDFSETTDAYVNSTNLIYGENVNFEITVTDAIYELEITGLQNKIDKDENLNISVEINKLLDNITYEIYILATNVTNGIPTKIEIQFFKYNESKQLIWIFLEIEKKESNLSIDTRNIQDVIYYEDNITLLINLENDIGENETITKIVVNGVIDIFDFIVLSDGYFQFNFDSRMLGGKGNYTLDIYAESSFFKANNSLDVEVNPLEAQITVQVSEFEVLEGAQLIITGQLTLLNGTPIRLVDITITLYIIEKVNGKAVYAFEADYYNTVIPILTSTDFDGYFQVVFEMSDEIDYIDIEASYAGSDIYGITASVLEEPVYSIPPPGLPSWLLYTIIGGSLALALIVSIIVYKLTRRKPFQQFLE
ncbi:MAG: hypothetical protein KAR08_08645, partial [Candidatus Heimdallarchaeota archaeon]|nr:hypothetical protein [Candidatus Heimdallarchaeota archaeon]